MDEIVRAKRVAEGILLTVKTKDGEKDVIFGFSELIDREINALHLLQAPHKYLCDPKGRIIVRRHRKG
jgi:hypothetical protein